MTCSGAFNVLWERSINVLRIYGPPAPRAQRVDFVDEHHARFVLERSDPAREVEAFEAKGVSKGVFPEEPRDDPKERSNTP